MTGLAASKSVASCLLLVARTSWPRGVLRACHTCVAHTHARVTLSRPPGARLLRILYGKYTAAGWTLRLAADPDQALALAPGETGPDPRDEAEAAEAKSVSNPVSVTAFGPELAFVRGVLDLVECRIGEARADLYGACRRSLVTGPLLLLRYVAEDAPWAALAAGEAAGEAAGVVARLLTAAQVRGAL